MPELRELSYNFCQMLHNICWNRVEWGTRKCLVIFEHICIVLILTRVQTVLVLRGIESFWNALDNCCTPLNLIGNLSRQFSPSAGVFPKKHNGSVSCLTNFRCCLTLFRLRRSNCICFERLSGIPGTKGLNNKN